MLRKSLMSRSRPTWDAGDVLGVERFVVVGEPDSAVELRVAGELAVEPGHADEDDAHVGPVEEVADLLEPVHLESVGFVDD